MAFFPSIIKPMKVEILDYRYNFLYPDTNVDFHLWKKNIVPYHTHANYYELIFILQGPFEQILNEKRMILEQNLLMIIRPNDCHSMSFPEDQSCLHANLSVKKDFFEHCVSLISPNLLHKVLQEDGLSIKLNKHETSQVNYFIKKYNMSHDEDQQQKQAIITSLFFFLISIFIVQQKEDNSSQLPSWFNSFLQKINSPEFVDKSAKDLYNISPCSTASLIRIFKKYLNCTPTEYLTSIKINYACNMLQNTDYSIIYICNEVGFASLSHFNHLFKKYKNITPTEFRKIKYSPSTDINA